MTTSEPTTAAVAGRDLRTQGRRTMTRLLDAGTEALAEHGYQASRVDDVVRIAGVSHGTFYLYFENKEDLLRAMAHRCAGEMEALAGELGEVDHTDAGLAELRRWIGQFLALYRRHGVVIRSWAEGQVADRSLARLGATSFAHVTGRFAELLAAPGLDERALELRAAALLAMLERTAFLVTTREFGWEDATVLDALAATVHRGFFAHAS